MKILVTGGAGYIGSHVVRQLGEAGHDVVVIDNLSTGFLGGARRPAGRSGPGGPCRPRATVRRAPLRRGHALRREPCRAGIGVQPLKYYRNNTVNMVSLLEQCARHGVDRFVFSSTCAVYGQPKEAQVTEQTPLAPINPYGASKMMSERILMDASAASSLRCVSLRYFNVAGADPQLRLGQATRDATQLIKVACETALGRRPEMSIYGTDYPTRDGTCIRDYIHVEDLARAHLDALDYLGKGGASEVLNCGYGHGSTVKEVVEAVRRVSGRKVPARDAPRRPGDAVELFADNTRIRRVLGWKPRHDDLDFIVDTAWRWELKKSG